MSKYRAIKTECLAGHIHDSKKEAGRCDQLHTMELAGTISDLEFQPEYPCHVNGKLIFIYKSDFRYRMQDLLIVEDVKGVQTAVFRIKRKLVEALYPGVLISLYPPVVRKKRKAKARVTITEE